MRKKILSLALALVMCLGLTIPAFAEEVYSTTYEGMTITGYSDGSVNLTGSGKLTPEHLLRATEIAVSLTNDTEDVKTVSINIGTGITGMSDYSEFKEQLNSMTQGASSAWSIYINGTPIQTGTKPVPEEKDDFKITRTLLYQYTGDGGDVVIPSGVTRIMDYSFQNCTGVKSVTIPSGVTIIWNNAFCNCTSLKSVNIPSSIRYIDYSAFENCTSLTDVYYDGSKAQWDAIEIEVDNGCLTEATIHYNSGESTTTPTQPQQPAGTTASPTNDKLEVNGSAADPTVYKIGGSNYFKIRDVAALLNGTEKQFSVGYDGEKNAVTATTGQGYEKQSGDLAGAAKGGNQAAAASNDAIYVNGEKITAEVYKINGSNYFKLRDLGKALDFYVGWTAERGMYIETGKPYSE